MPGFLRLPKSRTGQLLLAGMLLLILAAALLRLYSGVQSSSAQVAAPCPGDSNLDMSFDVRDMVVILGHILNRETLSGGALENADVNQDSQINVQDIVRLMQHNLGRSPLAECTVIEPKATPWIRFVVPQQGPPGTKVTLAGSGFSPIRSQNKVMFIDPDPVVKGQVTAADEDGIEIRVPNDLANAIYLIEVEVDGRESNSVAFEVTDTSAPLEIRPSIANIVLPPGTGKEVLAVGGGTPPYKLKTLTDDAKAAADVNLSGSVISVSAKTETWANLNLEVEDSADPPATSTARVSILPPLYAPEFKVLPSTLLAGSSPAIRIESKVQSSDLQTQSLEITLEPLSLSISELKPGSVIGITKLWRYESVVGFQLLQVEEINSSSVRFKVSMAQNNTLETIGQGVLDEVSGKMKIEMLPSPAPESLNRGTYTMELYLSDQIFTLPENVGETFKFTAVYTSTRLSSDGNLHLTKTVTQSFQTTAPAFGAPRIERLNPDVGPIGRIVHIEGVGFSPENGKNRVTFVGPEGDRIETQVITASPGELVVWVPEEAVTGTVRVEVADLESNDYRFRVPFHPAAGLFFEQLLAGTAALPRLLLSQPAEEDSAYNQTPFFGEIRIKEATFELDAGSIQVDALTEDQEVGRIYFYNRVNGSESSLLMIYRGLESETGRYRFEGMAGKNHLMTILLSDNSPDGVTFKVEVPYVINTGLTWLFEFSEAIYLPPFPTGTEINVKTTVRSDQWHPIPGLAMEVEILAKAVAQ